MEPQSAEPSRLVRPHHGRMIAGVCQGVGDHFHIDPLIVRIGFVVTSFFGGAGAIAYGAGWVLLPEEDAPASMAERVVRDHHWGRIAGLVLIAIALSSITSSMWWFHGGTFFAVLLIVGGVLLLAPGVFDHDHVPYSPPTPGPTATPPPPATQPSPPPTTFVDPRTPPTTLLEPPPPPTPPRVLRGGRRRGGIGTLTLGLLFVGGGIVGLVVAAGNSIDPSSVFAVGLLIVGAALVLSAWIGRSLILIPIGVVLVGLLSVSTVIDVPLSGGIGRRDVNPLALSDVQDEYHLGVGQLQLDLTHVAFDHGTTRHIKISVGVGHVLVRVPRNVVVELHGHAGMGEVHFLDQHEGGVDVDRDATLPAAGEQAPHLALDAEVGIGQVEVLDAAA